jgi:hypothetical protein
MSKYIETLLFKIQTSKHNPLFKTEYEEKNEDYKELIKFCENKTIALVGGSKNIIKKKNKIDDYDSYCKKNSIKLLNVEKNDEYYFDGKKLEIENKKNIKLYRDISPAKYLKAYKENYRKIDLNYIKTYFEKSKFKENFVV